MGDDWNTGMIIAQRRSSGFCEDPPFASSRDASLQLGARWSMTFACGKWAASQATMWSALLLAIAIFRPHAWAEAFDPDNGQSSCTLSPTSSGLARATPSNASGRHLYVSTIGSDAKSGSADAPFRTIQKASRAATAGTTIHVAPGSYNETITSRVSGTAYAPVRFVSALPHAAVIKPSGATGAIWSDSGDYVTIEGFKVDGSDSRNARIGILMSGSHVYVRANEVHHIILNGANDSKGGAGIVLDGGYYNKIDQNAIGNDIHDVGTATSDRIHGIYHQSSGSIVNNVVHSNPGSTGIVLWHDAKNITIANNTVVDNTVGISVGSGDWYHGPVPADHVTVINNLVYGNQAAGIQEHGLTGIHNLYRNNLVYGNAINWSLQNGSTHQGTISADPQFVNYRHGDYRLKSSSPAIAAGTALSALECHVDRVRPPEAAPNVGAEAWSPAQAPD
jgi:parallel beta-helix repeat protein